MKIHSKKFSIARLAVFVLKGSSDPSYFMFEIIVGKSRIRNITSLHLNGTIVNRFKSL